MLVYEPAPMTTISEASLKAVILAKEKNENIELHFNGAKIIVSKQSNKEDIENNYWKQCQP